MSFMSSYLKFIDPLNIMGTQNSGMAKAPHIATPSTQDPDRTPGSNAPNPAAGNAASQNILSNNTSMKGRLLS
jgi:hypothetical protein